MYRSNHFAFIKVKCVKSLQFFIFLPSFSERFFLCVLPKQRGRELMRFWPGSLSSMNRRTINKQIHLNWLFKRFVVAGFLFTILCRFIILEFICLISGVLCTWSNEKNSQSENIAHESKLIEIHQKALLILYQIQFDYSFSGVYDVCLCFAKKQGHPREWQNARQLQIKRKKKKKNKEKQFIYTRQQHI